MCSDNVSLLTDTVHSLEVSQDFHFKKLDKIMDKVGYNIAKLKIKKKCLLPDGVNASSYLQINQFRLLPDGVINASSYLQINQFRLLPDGIINA